MPQILINKGACEVVSKFVISDRIDKMLTLSVLIHFVLNSQLFSRNFFLHFHWNDLSMCICMEVQDHKMTVQDEAMQTRQWENDHCSDTYNIFFCQNIKTSLTVVMNALET